MRGLRVLVTGAGRRVGKVIADDLEKAEACVFRHTRADGDIRTPVDCEWVVDLAVRRLGGLDGLVLSASTFRRTPFRSLTVADWNELIETNLRSVFVMALAASHVMKQGAIVVIGDGSTARPWKNYLPYAVSKAALRPLVANLALELAPAIRVNMVSPGPILPPETQSQALTRRIARLAPLRRTGRPEDILPAIRDALTNEFMTGAEIRIDGGRGI